MDSVNEFKGKEVDIVFRDTANNPLRFENVVYDNIECNYSVGFIGFPYVGEFKVINLAHFKSMTMQESDNQQEEE